MHLTENQFVPLHYVLGSIERQKTSEKATFSSFSNTEADVKNKVTVSLHQPMEDLTIVTSCGLHTV
jgi:hypothetical protein